MMMTISIQSVKPIRNEANQKLLTLCQTIYMREYVEINFQVGVDFFLEQSIHDYPWRAQNSIPTLIWLH